MATDCRTCHDPQPGFSHPVEVTPRGPVSDHLPLDSGRITCLTCHDLGAAGKPGDVGQALLRQSGPALCRECHDPHSVTRGDQHATALNKAHVLWPGRAGLRKGRVARVGFDVDAGSSACLSCHDGG
ncbi:MAG: cytochrome c3 family protein, partial [Planctomycetota bacterium]